MPFVARLYQVNKHVDGLPASCPSTTRSIFAFPVAVQSMGSKPGGGPLSDGSRAVRSDTIAWGTVVERLLRHQARGRACSRPTSPAVDRGQTCLFLDHGEKKTSDNQQTLEPLPKIPSVPREPFGRPNSACAEASVRRGLTEVRCTIGHSVILERQRSVLIRSGP